MAQQTSLSDRELLGIWRDERTTDADLALLTPEEQTRLVTLVESQESGPSGLERALGALPAVGGAAGGILGGMGGTAFGMGVGGLPGAVGGAALGGAAGESLEQLLSRLVGLEAPESSGAAAGQIAAQAGLQGALEGAGGTIAKGARGAGRLMMRKAVRPTPSLQKAFPGVDIPDVLVREGLPVGASAKAAAARQASGREATGVLREAGAGGVRVATTDIARQSADDVGRELLERGLNIDAPEFQQLGDVALAWIGKHEAQLTPSQANNLKRAAQKLSQAVMRAERETGGAEAASVAAQFQRGISQAARATIERAVPAVAPINQRTQGLIAAGRALRDVEARNTMPFLVELGTPAAAALPVMLGAGAGGAFLGALLFRVGASPRALSRLGISLSHPVAQATLQQLPRLTAEGGRQLMRSAGTREF